MALVFRPSAAGAVSARGYASRMAGAMRTSGTSASRKIVDGVLLSGFRSGDSIVVDAILLDGAFVSMYTFPLSPSGGFAPVIYPAVKTNKRTMLLGKLPDGRQSTDFWLYDYLSGSWAIAGDAFEFPTSGSIGRATSVPVASLRAKASMFPRSGLADELQRNDQVIRVYNSTPAILRNDVDSSVRVEKTNFGTVDTTRLAGFLLGFSAWGFPAETDRLNALLARAALRSDKSGLVVATKQPEDILLDSDEGWVLWFDATVGVEPTAVDLVSFALTPSVLPAELVGNTDRASSIEPLAVVTTSDSTASLIARITAYFESPPDDPYNEYGYVCIDVDKGGALSASTLLTGEYVNVTGSAGIHTRRPGDGHLATDDALVIYVNDSAGTTTEQAAVSADELSVYVVHAGGAKTEITPSGYFIPRGTAEVVGGSPNGQVVFDAGTPIGRYRYGVNPLGASICACGDGLLVALCVPAGDFYEAEWALQYRVLRADTLAEVYSSPTILTVPWQAIITVSSLSDASYDAATDTLTHGDLLLAVARPQGQSDAVRGLYRVRDGATVDRVMRGTAGYPLEQFTDMVYVSDTLAVETMYPSAFASW